MREGVRRGKGLADPESWPTGSTRPSRVGGGGGQLGRTRGRYLSKQGTLTVLSFEVQRAQRQS